MRSRSISIGCMCLLCACGSASDPWALPDPPHTGVSPRDGKYTFSAQGCFSVAGSAIAFARDCTRFDTIAVVQGGFINRWGDIGGTNCPTDGYAISGPFDTTATASGTIKYAAGCQVTESSSFTAAWSGP